MTAAPNLDRTFAALADPTRRALMARLQRGEQRMTDLAAPFPVSLPAISKHLRTLEQAGLIDRRVEGREHRFALAPGGLDATAAWIDQARRFWEGQLDQLDAFLRETVTPPADTILPAKDEPQ